MSTPRPTEPGTRSIGLPALDRRVPLRTYIAAIRLAKSAPEREFRHGLTTWWPTTGAEIMRQFRSGMAARINEAIPYIERGANG